jgi:hypothetical protein
MMGCRSRGCFRVCRPVLVPKCLGNPAALGHFACRAPWPIPEAWPHRCRCQPTSEEPCRGWRPQDRRHAAGLPCESVEELDGKDVANQLAFLARWQPFHDDHVDALAVEALSDRPATPRRRRGRCPGGRRPFPCRGGFLHHRPRQVGECCQQDKDMVLAVYVTSGAPLYQYLLRLKSELPTIGRGPTAAARPRRQDGHALREQADQATVPNQIGSLPGFTD